MALSFPFHFCMGRATPPPVAGAWHVDQPRGSPCDTTYSLPGRVAVGQRGRWSGVFSFWVDSGPNARKRITPGHPWKTGRRLAAQTLSTTPAGSGPGPDSNVSRAVGGFLSFPSISTYTASHQAFSSSTVQDNSVAIRVRTGRGGSVAPLACLRACSSVTHSLA